MTMNVHTPRAEDDAIERWHSDKTATQPLHEYLDMTWDEYAAWVENGTTPVAKTERDAR